MFRKFFTDTSGNIAPMFALAALPLIAATGAVVDYSNGFQKRQLVQGALDAAAIAANRINGIETEARVRDEANAIYLANLEGKISPVPTLGVEIGVGTVEASTNLVVSNYFLGIAGLEEQSYDLFASSVLGGGTFEVVMVLDNSGSMYGSKISTLRTAARDLSDLLFDVNVNNPKDDPLKIGIVPFSRAVNVGSSNENAAWMDGTAVGTYHHEHFDTPTNRFDLFDEIGGVSWQGCVEARPFPNDTMDTSPSVSDADSMFVPYFAPDEPDTGGYYTNYQNDYLSDTGGSCTGGSGGWTWVPGVGWTWDPGPTDEERQARVCKYDGSYVSSYDNGVSKGPNIGCTANPLMPMTTSQSTVNTNINALKASGMTNINQGIVWGWRLLSPGAPFTEGRAYDTDDNSKILIVMTDGANTYTTQNSFNRSGYGAYSYVVKNHLGTTSTSNSVVVDKMNDRTAATCENVKAEGVRVYTIAFQVSDQDTKDMLAACATDPGMAFQSDNNAELLAAFTRIGTEISELRLDR